MNPSSRALRRRDRQPFHGWLLRNIAPFYVGTWGCAMCRGELGNKITSSPLRHFLQKMDPRQIRTRYLIIGNRLLNGLSKNLSDLLNIHKFNGACKGISPISASISFLSKNKYCSSINICCSGSCTSINGIKLSFERLEKMQIKFC